MPHPARSLTQCFPMVLPRTRVARTHSGISAETVDEELRTVQSFVVSRRVVQYVRLPSTKYLRPCTASPAL